jgi:hypothetical protein
LLADAPPFEPIRGRPAWKRSRAIGAKGFGELYDSFGRWFLLWRMARSSARIRCQARIFKT